MSNQQLYLAIGVPMFVTIMGFALQAKYIDARFDSIQKQLDQLYTRMTDLGVAMRSLYETSGRHDKALEMLEKRVG